MPPSGPVANVQFEHAWVEVLVPFAQYRGLPTGIAIDCSQQTNASLCVWAPIDASFKQMTYNGLNIDPYAAAQTAAANNTTISPISSFNFDYTGYYNAIQSSSTSLMNKNPLTILEEEISVWLRTAYPGKTLQDVANFGQINPILDGLLPASLPYTVISSIRNYDCITATSTCTTTTTANYVHDAAVVSTTNPSYPEPKKWDKTITFTNDGCNPNDQVNIVLGTASESLSQVVLSQLTSILVSSTTSGITTLQQIFRLNGNQIGSALSLQAGSITITCAEGKKTVQTGMEYWINVKMDGPPGVNGSADTTIQANYQAMIGGYYLIATGGETSNWGQVHNAAQQLLTANTQYPITFNSAQTGSSSQACSMSNSLGCTPYLNNGVGYTIANELLNNQAPMDALVGGLLNVAATQYFANLRDSIKAADGLMQTYTPIAGFLGVVSTSDQSPQYVDSTAFSISPGGLLIDMKGITIGGTYRKNVAPANNDPTTNFSNSQFQLMGHITSSLEHETWQELTGYDAISTVRGIQMALANPVPAITLMTVQNNVSGNPPLNSTQNSAQNFYTAMGFGSSPPSSFTYTQPPYTIFSTEPATWTNATSGASFDTFMPQAATEAQAGAYTYTYSTSTGLYAWVNCVAGQINGINKGNLYSATCDGTTLTGTTATAQMTEVSTDWTNSIIPDDIGQTYFNFFDIKQDFSPSSVVYRASPLSNPTNYPAFSVANVVNDVYLTPLLNLPPSPSTSTTPLVWVSYQLPSALVTTPYNYFQVDIRSQYTTSTGYLNSMTFQILNMGSN